MTGINREMQGNRPELAEIRLMLVNLWWRKYGIQTFGVEWQGSRGSRWYFWNRPCDRAWAGRGRGGRGSDLAPHGGCGSGRRRDRGARPPVAANRVGRG